MKPRTRLAVGVVASGIGLALACGPVPGRPPPVAPINQCPNTPCSAYTSPDAVVTCVDGVCQSPTLIDYVLTIGMPETGGIRAAAGYTLVLKSSEFFARSSLTCGKPDCIVTPDLVPFRGVYVVPPSEAQKAGVRLSSTNDPVSLPVRSEIRPFFRTPKNEILDSARYGLPVYPILADMNPRRAGDPYLGPFDTVGIDFRVGAQPGQYQVIVAPAPPFDTLFPPYRETREVSADQLLLITSVYAPIKFPVSRVGGSLEGFTARLVDEDTARTQSTIVVLKDGDTSFALTQYLSPPSAPGPTPKLDLILEPPLSEPGLPTFVYKFVAGTTLPPLIYPAISPLVPVTGAVTGVPAAGGSEGVPATLVFDSANVIPAGTPPVGPTLRYRQRVDTDDAGRYSVALQAGTYRVSVTPHARASTEPAGRYAKTVVADVKIGAASAGVEQPFVLRVAARLRGRAFLADGRALPNATIMAEASTTLSAEIADTGAFFDALPRPSNAVTGPDGSFEIVVDPGTFDLTVRPYDESRWPWIVLPAQTFAAADADLGTLVVPVPTVEAYEIRDPLENPVRGAVVQAFALPLGGTSLVRIGLAQTNQEGRFVMDLAGLPFVTKP